MQHLLLYCNSRKAGKRAAYIRGLRARLSIEREWVAMNEELLSRQTSPETVVEFKRWVELGQAKVQALEACLASVT